MGTYSHSTYMHKGLSVKQLITTKVSFQFFIYCQYGLAIRLRVDSFISLKPKIFFREKMTLVDWHNHDDRLDDNNQI